MPSIYLSTYGNGTKSTAAQAAYKMLVPILNNIFYQCSQKKIEQTYLTSPKRSITSQNSRGSRGTKCSTPGRSTSGIAGHDDAGAASLAEAVADWAGGCEADGEGEDESESGETQFEVHCEELLMLLESGFWSREVKLRVCGGGFWRWKLGFVVGDG
jgi:hypothetical protein